MKPLIRLFRYAINYDLDLEHIPQLTIILAIIRYRCNEVIVLAATVLMLSKWYGWI
jgi:hypothetical protein